MFVQEANTMRELKVQASGARSVQMSGEKVQASGARSVQMSGERKQAGRDYL